MPETCVPGFDTVGRMEQNDPPSLTTSAPRIDHLDLLRGIAVLGILWMNAVSFGMSDAAYFRLDWEGWSWASDKVVGVVARVMFDQKMMGLFSLLFGASIVLFLDRVSQRHAHPVRLSLWRNTLLLAMGVVHFMFWEGDVLMVYALCSPLVLLLRKLPVVMLYTFAGAAFGVSAVSALALQEHINNTDSAALGWMWVSDEWPSMMVEGWYIADAFARALSMMLIGVGMYRTGILAGARPASWYRRCALVGLGVGVPLACANLVLQFSTDFSAEIALSSFAFNTLATVPITLGIVGVVMWWSHPERASSGQALRLRLQAVGRMALTNYLSQTMLGLLVLGSLAELVDLHRTHVALFVITVWALQLWWSPRWLARFTMGPVEWLWRLATYRHRQPLRQSVVRQAPQF
jgi:uncharacterized protein